MKTMLVVKCIKDKYYILESDKCCIKGNTYVQQDYSSEGLFIIDEQGRDYNCGGPSELWFDEFFEIIGPSPSKAILEDLDKCILADGTEYYYMCDWFYTLSSANCLCAVMKLRHYLDSLKHQMIGDEQLDIMEIHRKNEDGDYQLIAIRTEPIIPDENTPRGVKVKAWNVDKTKATTKTLYRIDHNEKRPFICYYDGSITNYIGYKRAQIVDVLHE